MPITKSAIKKQRSDKRKAEVNRPVKSKMKSAIKDARENLTKESVVRLYSALDIAVKKNLTSKNRAARLKSRILKSAKSKEVKSPFGKTKKTTK